MKKLFAWIHKYERHLSAGAMVLGFIVDNIFFNRIDEALTHTVFLSYLGIAAITIAWLHRLEEYSVEGAPRPKWRSVLPIVTQFALGGLWSGFLIFYARSATLAASWPFLLLLGGIFLGNEIFKKYHDRLVFNAVLYFFALYSYAIFTAPLLTHEIGTNTFILSGVAAVLVFALFMVVLRILGRFRVLKSIWQIRFWVGCVVVVMNVCYFTNILPPLPLTLAEGGIYHRITKTAGGYLAEGEPQSLSASFGIPPTIHVAPQAPLYAFSAVFAPIAISTEVTHEWQWYDPAKSSWVTQLALSFPISGGREGGYRGYTILRQPSSGDWRVTIKSKDGRTIGRFRFKVEIGARGAVETTQL